MKKYLFLFLILMITFNMSSQQKDNNQNQLQFGSKPNNTNNSDHHWNRSVDVIGETEYYLQTEASVPKRVHMFDDHSIGAIWMMGLDEPDFNDRGTGYNYYSNGWEEIPDTRIESHIADFPVYAPYGTEGEIIVSYSDDPLIQLACNKRQIKGNGEWETFNLLGPDGYRLSHPAMITTDDENESIHLLAITSGNEYLEQEHAILYYRSTDGGQTWDINAHHFEGLGKDYLSSINPNTYSWAESRDGIIAFSVGFTSEDGFIMKSYNNGDTWEKITVYENPFSPYIAGATNKFGGGDGAQAIALDEDGMLHIAFGRMVYYYNSNDSVLHIPLTSGLVYWNENMDILDTTRISSFTIDSLEINGNLVKDTFFEEDSITMVYDYGTKSLASFPQISVGYYNNLHFIWSMLAPGYENNEGSVFRHVWKREYDFNENKWDVLGDLTGDIFHLFNESTYPAIFDDRESHNMHIILLTFSENPINKSNDQLLPGLIEYTGYYYGPFEITEINKQKHFSVSQNSPNPFSGKTEINIYCEKPVVLKFSVYTVLGNLIYTKDLGHFQEGTSTLEISDTYLTKGIYIYSVSDGTSSAMNKMILK